jgi:predicted esterase
MDYVALFRAAAERETFIIVAPDSRIAPNGQPSWQVPDRPGDTTEDLAHIQACLAEVREMPHVQVDTSRTLVAGHSGGGSSAPYVASVDDFYTAFAVLHGGVFAGGLGPRRVRGWLSTGEADVIRPPAGVQSAAAVLRNAGFSVEYHEFHEEHGVGAEEVEALVRWWLHG